MLPTEFGRRGVHGGLPGGVDHSTLSTKFDCSGTCGHRSKPVFSLADELLQGDATVNATPLLVAVHSHGNYGVSERTRTGGRQSASAYSFAVAPKTAEQVLQPGPAVHHGARRWATLPTTRPSPCSSSFPSLQSSTSAMEVGKTAALVERPRLQSYTNTHKKGRRAKEFVPYRHCRTGYPPARMFWSPGGEPRQRGRRRRA